MGGQTGGISRRTALLGAGGVVIAGATGVGYRVTHPGARTLTGHAGQVYSVACAPDGQMLASGSEDATIRLWRVRDGAFIRSIATLPATEVLFLPDGKTLASGLRDNTVRLWGVNDGALIATLMGHTDRVYSIAVSSDGQTLASASGDHTIRLWRLNDPTPFSTISTGGRSITGAIAFTADGQTLVAVVENTVNLWRVSDSTLVRSISVFPAPFIDSAMTVPVRVTLALSPDGRSLAQDAYMAPSYGVWRRGHSYQGGRGSLATQT